MVLKSIVQIIILLIFINNIIAEIYDTKNFQFKIGLIEYEPGDWNSDQTALAELISFINTNTNIPIMSIKRDEELKMKLGSNNFFKTQYIYMTGHGELRNNGLWQGIKLKDNEIKALRKHLLNGGFLHIDDNYNFDKTFFSEMKKVFPDKEWVVLPNEHKIFNIYYQFNNGLPKIHKHDNKEPKMLALFDNNRIIALYTIESDLGDGWESNEEHERITGEILNPQKRLEALKMGANILIFALSQ
tara:strand:- start:5845 stop:6576 length:732 start_codon:yes stop_codon:yes gene_type:complete